ncbi:succinate dehydrogenase, cytochrome b556 subunit [Pyruvatibacter sp.]|uniref:succinate dehydrogenase, cytochrome b556 subunit n=1 Tax=Pyruvatibacter sp. TaxID=1981328 RepID=UPI0032ED2B92
MADAPVEAAARQRPLSPHLGIYKPLMSMMMSIVHRITGVALFFGTLILAWWLAAAAIGPDAYATFMATADSTIGRLVLFGYTWALIHHMLGGLRHFLWDSGHGFALRTVDVLAWGTLICSITLTLVIWFATFRMMGAM